MTFKTPRNDDGFSLVEVLAALGVFSIAALGLGSLSAETTRNAAQIDVRTYARIEASNVMAEALAQPAPLSVGVSTGQRVQRGRALTWVRTLTAAPGQPGLILIDVTVSDAVSGQQVAQLQSARYQP